LKRRRDLQKKTIKKKKVKVPAVPKRLATDLGERRRTQVERYTEDSAPKKEKEIVVKKGKGKKLEDCENVVTETNKRTRNDPVLKILYSILFGRVTKKSPIKDNLLAFSGVVYEEDEAEKGRDKLLAKIEKLTVHEIKDVLIFFGQNPEGLKEELVEKLADFLEKPKASTEDYSHLKKRKRSSSKSRSRSKSPAKKEEKDEERKGSKCSKEIS